MPIALRQNFLATTGVVPDPQKQSKTVPPGGQNDLTKNSTKDSGNGASFSCAKALPIMPPPTTARITFPGFAMGGFAYTLVG